MTMSTERTTSNGPVGIVGPVRGRRRGAQATTWIAALPALAILAVFLLLPLIAFMTVSFTAGDGGFTWGHYAEVFTVDRYRLALFNSLWISVVSTALALALALPAALYLAQVKGPLGSVLDAILTFPLSLPGVAIGFFIIVLFGRVGLATQLSTRVTGEPILFIAYAVPGLLLAYLYFQVPRILGTLRGAVSTLDPDLPIVARTLGASSPRITFTVIVPALMPALVSAAGLAIATSLGAYGTVAALSQGFRVLPLDVAEQGAMLGNNELAGAMALLLAVISLVFTLLSDLAVKLMSSKKGRAK